MIKFVNLTPHMVTIIPEYGGGPQIDIPPSGTIARVREERNDLPPVRGIPIREIVYGGVCGLPSQVSGDTLYIVSNLVARRSGRNDVLAPDTGFTAIRGAGGRIVAVRRLQSFVTE